MLNKKNIKSNFTALKLQSINFFHKFPGLFEERAIVLGRMGMHENAISIYMRTLNDVEKAMQYCDNVYHRKQEGYKSVSMLY